MHVFLLIPPTAPHTPLHLHLGPPPANRIGPLTADIERQPAVRGRELCSGLSDDPGRDGVGEGDSGGKEYMYTDG